MLLVKTKIAPSSIDGIGLFADEYIPQGTPLWKFHYPDVKLDKSAVAELSAPAKEQFLKYAYLNPRIDKYILCFDDARFFNHAEDPNCIELPSPDGEDEGMNVAARDIQPGEELTCDYRVFDSEFVQKIRKEK